MKSTVKLVPQLLHVIILTKGYVANWAVTWRVFLCLWCPRGRYYNHHTFPVLRQGNVATSPAEQLAWLCEIVSSSATSKSLQTWDTWRSTVSLMYSGPHYTREYCWWQVCLAGNVITNTSYLQRCYYIMWGGAVSGRLYWGKGCQWLAIMWHITWFHVTEHAPDDHDF